MGHIDLLTLLGSREPLLLSCLRLLNEYFSRGILWKGLLFSSTLCKTESQLEIIWNRSEGTTVETRLMYFVANYDMTARHCGTQSSLQQRSPAEVLVCFLYRISL